MTCSTMMMMMMVVVKLRDDPEKKPKDYSMPCEKPSNEGVYDVRKGQPTKFVKQTSDRSCITIIFFDKMGSTTLNTFELLAPHGRGATPYTDCRWRPGYRQIALSMNHTPEYLRGRGPDDRLLYSIT